MTKFERESFEFFGDTLTYKGRFVARFKYNKSGLAGWISFMIKNISVEEYFDAYEAGNAPLQIMNAFGYVSPNIKKAIKMGSYTMEEYVRSLLPLKVKATA